MRVLLVLAAIVLVLALVGWVKFDNSPERSTISIDKEAVQQDTQGMVEKGNAFLDETREAVAPSPPNYEAIESPGADEQSVPPSTVPESPPANSLETETI